MCRFIPAFALITALSLTLVSAGEAQSRRKPAKPTRPAKTVAKPAAPLVPRFENQFVTVDEFVKAGRAKGTPVSVEGYAVIGYKNGAGVKLSIVDSVDHVLNAADANNFAAGGASAVIAAAPPAKKSAWSMAASGLGRFTMYTGAGMAQRELHDIVAKLRITGRAAGKTVMVTAVEYMDDNGDWKHL